MEVLDNDDSQYVLLLWLRILLFVIPMLQFSDAFPTIAFPMSKVSYYRSLVFGFGWAEPDGFLVLSILPTSRYGGL